MPIGAFFRGMRRSRSLVLFVSFVRVSQRSFLWLALVAQFSGCYRKWRGFGSALWFSPNPSLSLCGSASSGLCSTVNISGFQSVSSSFLLCMLLEWLQKASSDRY